MVTKFITLKIESTSTEGTHDFIKVLENIIEDIKGGVEGGLVRDTLEGGEITTTWELTPHD